MVYDFTSHPTISPDVDVLHNNILGFIEKIQYRVDIENNTMVVHTRSNPLISKHRKSGT